MTTRYIPHILYSLALTSFSMHLLNTRHQSATLHAAFLARQSVLTSLIERLKAGENVSDAEVMRLKLEGDERGMVAMCELPGGTEGGGTGGRLGMGESGGGGLGKGGTSWKETVMGRESKGHEDLKQLEECMSSLSRPSYSVHHRYRKQT